MIIISIVLTVLFLFCIFLIIKGIIEDEEGYIIIGAVLTLFVSIGGLIHIVNITKAISSKEVIKKLYGADYSITEMYYNEYEIRSYEDYKFRYPKEEK